MPNFVLYDTTGKITSYLSLSPPMIGLDGAGNQVVLLDYETVLQEQLALGMHDQEGQTPSYIEIADEIATAEDMSQYYVLNGVFTEKPILNRTWSKTTIVADNTDSTTVSNLLPNTTVTVSVKAAAGAVTPEPYTTTTTEDYTLKTSQTGEYEVIVEVFPFKEHRTVITATEPT